MKLNYMNNYRILYIILKSFFNKDIIYHISKNFSRNYFNKRRKEIKKITYRTKNSLYYKKQYRSYHYYYH